MLFSLFHREREADTGQPGELHAELQKLWLGREKQVSAAAENQWEPGLEVWAANQRAELASASACDWPPVYLLFTFYSLRCQMYIYLRATRAAAPLSRHAVTSPWVRSRVGLKLRSREQTWKQISNRVAPGHVGYSLFYLPLLQETSARPQGEHSCGTSQAPPQCKYRKSPEWWYVKHIDTRVL